jgi:hypothetical protein
MVSGDYSATGAYSGTYYFYRMTGAFDEESVTWNTKPSIDTSAYVTWTPDSTATNGSLVTLDISSLLAKNGDLATFGLACIQVGGSGGSFLCQKEAGGGAIPLLNASYAVNVVDAPVFSSNSNYISGPTAITITSGTQGAGIYYTLNGGTPSAGNGILYSGPVTVNDEDVLKAIAVKTGFVNSAVTSCTYSYVSAKQVYTIEASKDANPQEEGAGEGRGRTQYAYMGQGSVEQYSHAAGTYNEWMYTTLTQWDISSSSVVSPEMIISASARFMVSSSYSATGSYSGTYYFYRLINSFNEYTVMWDTKPAIDTSTSVVWNPVPATTTNGSLVIFDVTSLLKNNGNLTTFGIACIQQGGYWANFLAQKEAGSLAVPLLTITCKKVDSPVFTPDSPYLSGGASTTVSMSCANKNAVIYYTLNGGSETQYSMPITVNLGDTLEAYAVKEGYLNSDVTSRTYSYPPVATPKFTPTGPYISDPTKAKITCDTAGATIYFTRNGSDPTTSSEQYTSSTIINIENGTTLKAIAVASNHIQSSIASITYTEVVTYDRPNSIEYGKATIDGNISEWATSTWAHLDQNYDSTAADVAEAYYAARWQKNKIYLAVKVRDTAHSFTDTYTAWNGRDAIEIFIHAGNSDDVTYFNAITAQQYVVGVKASDHDAVWSAIGGGGTILLTTNGDTFGGIGQAAGSVDGDWIYYEVAITPYIYLGFIETGNLSTSTELDLCAGDIIGLDVDVMAHNGSAFTGVKSENLMLDKSVSWQQFGLHALAEATLTPGDANGDGAVDVGDLGILAANYGGSNKTWSQGDFNNDGKVDVGDLGILAANYGKNASGADFGEDYAKVFGTENESANSEETGSSICSSLGLSLIAGLAFIGLMIVKLDE